MKYNEVFSAARTEKFFYVIFGLIVLAILAMQFGLIDQVAFARWGDRDMYRSANLWNVFQTTSAEFSYGDGARVPGGFMYYLWYVILLFDKTPVTLYHVQILLNILAGCTVGYIGKRYYGPVAGVAAFVLYGVSAIAYRNLQVVWNPGYIPFFIAGFFFFFFRAINEKKMKSLKWSTACIAIASQMHLSAALLLVPFFAAFAMKPSLLIRESRAFLASIAMILLFYSPYIASEALNGFHNTKLMKAQEQITDQNSIRNYISKSIDNAWLKLQGKDNSKYRDLSLKKTLALKNTKNVKVLPMRFSLERDIGASRSLFQSNLLKILANGLYILAAIGLMLFIYRKLPWVSQTEEQDKPDLALRATIIYILATMFYYFSDRHIHLELGHSARYLHALLSAICIASAFFISYLYRLMENKSLVLRNAFLTILTGVLIVPVYARMDELKPFSNHVGDYYLREEMLNKLSELSGWSRAELFGKTITVKNNLYGKKWFWNNEYHSAYDLLRRGKSFPGSLQSPCGVIFEGPQSIVGEVTADDLHQLFGQDTGPLKVLKQMPFQLSSGSSRVLVTYTREKGRCFSSNPDRYVPLAEERVTQQYYRSLKNGKPVFIPARSGKQEQNYLLSISNERYQRSTEKVVMYFRLANINDHLSVSLFSNQLRGLACNNNYFSSAMLGHPQLKFINNATKQIVIFPLAHDLVGHKGVLTPLHLQDLALKNGEYTIEFEASAIRGIDQVIWPMPNMQRIKKHVILTRNFIWPIV